MYNYFRIYFEKIQKIIQYIPYLWKDGDWDHVYILILLKYKLERVHNCLKNGMHCEKDRDCKNIKICINLLERLIKDDYSDKEFEKHFEKYGSENIFGEGNRLTLLRPLTDEEKEIERKEFKAIWEKEEMLRNQDYELLYFILKAHLREWWD